MNTHNVARGRDDLLATLAEISVPVVVGGINTDRLYPIEQQQYLADAIATCSSLSIIESSHGHDGFLIETQAVSELVSQTLSLGSSTKKS
jgi:homoserine O-acetyltransferase